jgi:signal transduction histidine kinase
VLAAKKPFRPLQAVSGVLGREVLQRLRAAPGAQPLSLARTPAGTNLTALCAVGVVAVTLLESVKPGLASLGSLLFIPVLLSAWLLARREAIIVSSLAVAARIVGYSIAGVDLGTAIAEVVTLGSLAIMTSAAAQAFVDGRERESRVAQHERELELLGERERIALQLTDTAIRRLYALSLRLQAASSVLQQRELQGTLSDAIDETDQLATDFRELIFKSDRVAHPH